MPGDLAPGMILWEYQAHGWDRARATEQQWLPPVEATEESLHFAPAILTGDYQGEGKAFAKPVDVPPTPNPWTVCSGYPVVIPLARHRRVTSAPTGPG